MSDANSKRAVAYLRVSSISQVDGHSLNAQERLFNQLCESRGGRPSGSIGKRASRPTQSR